jgi:SAM-dependent methyltransferase
VSFDVTADAYGRFMGRFSEPLGARFMELGELEPGQRALDVGCGPGALTAHLVARLGVSSVAAVDPSEPFVAATAARFPGIDVRLGGAEQLPFADDEFDVAYAQLVVHFMADPVAGLAEMARVTRPGGRVAACVWDYEGGTAPLSAFWTAVQALDPASPGEGQRAGTREGHLAELFEAAGLREIESRRLTVETPFATFEDWWEPYTLGVGPAGEYVAALDDAGREALRAECERRLPPAPFELAASAWSVRAQPRQRVR